jgi:hypothetical protein
MNKLAKIPGSSFFISVVRAIKNYFNRDSKKSEDTYNHEDTRVVTERITEPQIVTEISTYEKVLVPIRDDFDKHIFMAKRTVYEASEFLGHKKAYELLDTIDTMSLLADNAYQKKDQLLLKACLREIDYCFSFIEEQHDMYYEIINGCHESINYCKGFVEKQIASEMKSEDIPPLYVFMPQIANTIIDKLNDLQHLMGLVVQEHTNSLKMIPSINAMNSSINDKIEHEYTRYIPELQSAFNTIDNAKHFLRGAIYEENIRHLNSKSEVSEFFFGERGYREPSILTDLQSSNLPYSLSDLVHFTITSPPVVKCGTNFLIDVWAHLDEQRQEVLKRAKEEAGGSDIKFKSKGPVSLKRGNVLFVRLKIEGFEVDPLQDTILWEGEIGNATFAITVPSNTEFGSHIGICYFYANGLQILSLNFCIDIGKETLESIGVPFKENRYRSAFISYASDDNDAVLARIQGMKKTTPDMNVFYADASLHSGQKWKEELRKEIMNRDVLYLFWSKAASESKWVDWEWRCAYQEKGLDYIDPVPLVSPSVIPPPPELSDLHFNDWVLAYMRERHIPK